MFCAQNELFVSRDVHFVRVSFPQGSMSEEAKTSDSRKRQRSPSRKVEEKAKAPRTDEDDDATSHREEDEESQDDDELATATSTTSSDAKGDDDTSGESMSTAESIALVEAKRKELLEKMKKLPGHRKAKQEDDVKFAVYGDNVPDHTSGPPKGYFDKRRKGRRQPPRRQKKNQSDSDNDDDDSGRGDRYLARHHSRQED